MRSQHLQVVALENISYQDAWDYQEILHDKLKHDKRHLKDRTESNHKLVICQHKPVITLGKSGSLKNLLSSSEELDKSDIEFHKINRGGDITYHGPGQLTVYPIIDLEEYYRDVHKYVRTLEEIVIELLSIYRIKGYTIKDYTGVWTGKNPRRKICAIGVHLSRWVTMHGFALNVQTDLSYFNNIIPCGITTQDMQVTSLENEVKKKLDINDVSRHLLHLFTRQFPMDKIYGDLY